MMSLAAGSTESADPVEIVFPNIPPSTPALDSPVYTTWRLDAAGIEIRISNSAIRGISEEVLSAGENETNGILLGHREPGQAEIYWIERFERLLSVPELWPADTVGFYRGTAAASGFSEADALPDGLFLEILAGKTGDLAGQFFISRTSPSELGSHEPAGEVFVFSAAQHESPDDKALSHAKARRLVPDFDAAESPAVAAREFFLQPGRPAVEHDEEAGQNGLLRRFGPFFAALVLIGGAVWLLPQLLSPSKTGTHASLRRPLGLYVDPALADWRISWNRDASVLEGARAVRLFIHDHSIPGDDEQNGMDLSEQDLGAGMFAYKPAAHGGSSDISFRLEATGADGVISAETFRLVKTAPSAAAASTGPSAAGPSATPTNSAIPPKPIHRVAPEVSAGIRPRIRGKIPIDIKVRIDARGAVTVATPAAKAHNPVEASLIRSALRAAKQWTFEPASSKGKPVAGTQTLHFVFER